MNEIRNKPNIIFFLTDQQRWDTCGCYGQKMNITPNLDQMAKEGVRFEHAFSSQPICGPARAILQTGKYGTTTGCYNNNIPLPEDEKTIARYLTGAGYEVGYIGKWHLASDGDQHNYKETPVPPERRGGYNDFWLAADVLERTSHGYDGYMFDGDMNKVEFKGYRVDCETDFVIDYLRTRTGEQPFFLFLSYLEPHHQNDRKRFEGPEGSKKKYKDFEVPGDLVGIKGDWQENYPDYLGCCASLDENLGRIRQELKRLGLDNDTVIFFTSDHGCHFRTRPGGYKRSCHESSIRVPLVVQGPGFTGGKTVNELVSLINLPATLLACAGIGKPDDMQGEPLQPLLDEDNRGTDWQKEVFIQYADLWRAVRTDRWKYSVRAVHPKGERRKLFSDTYAEDFLYDLQSDPHERHNLATDPSLTDVRRQLAERLKKRMKEIGETFPKIVPG